MNKPLFDIRTFCAFTPDRLKEKPTLLGIFEVVYYGSALIGGNGLPAHDSTQAHIIMCREVHRRDGRTVIDWGTGDAPAATAGRSLDLYQAAAATVKAQALTLKESRAYFIDDNGKAASMEWDTFERERLPALDALRRSVSPHDDNAFLACLTMRPALVATPAAPSM